MQGKFLGKQGSYYLHNLFRCVRTFGPPLLTDLSLRSHHQIFTYFSLRVHGCIEAVHCRCEHERVVVKIWIVQCLQAQICYSILGCQPEQSK